MLGLIYIWRRLLTSVKEFQCKLFGTGLIEVYKAPGLGCRVEGFL